MIFYTVHEPPDAPVDRVDRAESLTFIGDRFAPAAVAFGPLWLLANRLWHAFGLYVAAFALAALVIFAAGLSPRWLSLVVSALNLFVAFEAASLKRWALEQRGWRTLGTVSGRSMDECERRFLEAWLPEQRSSSAPGMSSSVPGMGVRMAAAASGEASGGRLDTGRGGSPRSWLPWRTAR